MKSVWLSLLLMISACTLRAESPAAGVWAGRFPDRNPAVTLYVVDESGKLGGRAIFYVNRSGEIVGAEERPLISAKFENGVLSFEVTAPSDGTRLRFQMKIVSAKAGELSGEGQAIKMKKVE